MSSECRQVQEPTPQSCRSPPPAMEKQRPRPEELWSSPARHAPQCHEVPRPALPSWPPQAQSQAIGGPTPRAWHPEACHSPEAQAGHAMQGLRNVGGPLVPSPPGNRPPEMMRQAGGSPSWTPLSPGPACATKPMAALPGSARPMQTPRTAAAPSWIPPEASPPTGYRSVEAQSHAGSSRSPLPGQANSDTPRARGTAEAVPLHQQPEGAFRETRSRLPSQSLNRAQVATPPVVPFDGFVPWGRPPPGIRSEELAGPTTPRGASCRMTGLSSSEAALFNDRVKSNENPVCLSARSRRTSMSHSVPQLGMPEPLTTPKGSSVMMSAGSPFFTPRRQSTAALELRPRSPSVTGPPPNRPVASPLGFRVAPPQSLPLETPRQQLGHVPLGSIAGSPSLGGCSLTASRVPSVGPYAMVTPHNAGSVNLSPMPSLAPPVLPTPRQAGSQAAMLPMPSVASPAPGPSSVSPPVLHWAQTSAPGLGKVPLQPLESLAELHHQQMQQGSRHQSQTQLQAQDRPKPRKEKQQPAEQHQVAHQQPPQQQHQQQRLPRQSSVQSYPDQKPDPCAPQMFQPDSRLRKLQMEDRSPRYNRSPNKIIYQQCLTPSVQQAIPATVRPEGHWEISRGREEFIYTM